MPTSITTPPTGPRRVPVLGDRYAVIRRIGKGGAAGVYLVFDQNLEQWRAAKVLHRRHIEQNELRMRFLREARTMARLDDPHVVRVLDVVDQSQPFMVMEYIEGGCVLDWLRVHGPMPPFMAVKVLIDVCKALAATHSKRIIHRDVKPHNVLVTLQGACKLTDYGIAKIAPEDAGFAVDYDKTAEGASMGTDAFMSPEQRQDASKVDERADIYSVGATLYTLCTRKAAVDLCMWPANHPKLEPVPEVLREVLLKACHRVPDERYASMEAMEEALSAVLWSLPSVPASAPSIVMPLPDVPSIPPTTVDGDEARELADIWLDQVSTGHGVPIDEATFGSMQPAVSSLSGGASQPAAQDEPAEDIDPGENDVAFAPIAAVIAGSVVVGCVLLGTAVAAGTGAQQVDGAARAYHEAEAAYIASLEADPNLVDDMIAAGAVAGRLENARDALASAESYSKISAAELFYDAVHTGWNQIAESKTRPSLDDMRQLRIDWLDACDAWRASTGSEVGSVAISVGWAQGPGEHLVGERGVCR
ncbi:MAG: protein kinase [Myxococcota bacterium]